MDGHGDNHNDPRDASIDMVLNVRKAFLIKGCCLRNFNVMGIEQALRIMVDAEKIIVGSCRYPGMCCILVVTAPKDMASKEPNCAKQDHLWSPNLSSLVLRRLFQVPKDGTNAVSFFLAGLGSIVSTF